MVRNRVRIRFSKLGDLRMVGHRDLARCFERWFRRAGLPLAMSQGFHPKPRMSFPLALAVGIEATDEVMELELSEAVPADRLRRQLEPHAVGGLAVRSAEALPPGAKKARVRSVVYEAPVPADCQGGLAERIGRLLAERSCVVRRAGRGTSIDLRPRLEELSLERGVLRMRLAGGGGACPGPRDVLAALGLADLEARGVHLSRTAVEVAT